MQPQNSHGAGAAGARRPRPCPSHFPTLHKRLAASSNFCISDSALALKHFRQACPTELKHHGLSRRAAAPETTSVRENDTIQLHISTQQKTPQATLREHPWSSTPPQLWDRKQGAKSHHLPTSPGRKAFTSQRCHLHRPPLPFQQVSNSVCAAASDRKAQGGELIASREPS